MAVVTTGFFDGVHLGHRHVLETVVSAARERGEEAIVVTFWPHPRTVLQQDARDLRLLSTLEEKKEMLHAAGIDRVEVLPFTRSFAALTASEYLALLRDRFNASLIVMGYDNRIGSDNMTASELIPEARWSLNPSSLRSSSLPTSLRAVGPLPFTWPRAATGSGDQQPSETALPPVSSTQIRKALEEGRIDEANGMLGYRYGLYGVVVAGNRMGRSIGFPTANMQLYEPLKLVPANGAYVVEVEVLGKQYTGMCNIGLRPTVDGKVRTIETHILDFDEDIYGLPMGIRFVRRLRDERKFPSMEALRTQLVQDALNCKK
ncbi:MAG: bifunctional riboflavin kinase/FMN adenylyltransferase [Bacteroidales bacterium]|nr:bifunctional riboflavin kinase/FMN adenylyltransferase [Bacteroidales bacterium]